jgi:hypothetical protein
MAQPSLVGDKLHIRGGHAVGDHRLLRPAEVVYVDLVGNAASEPVSSTLKVAINNGGEIEHISSF